MKKKQVPFIPLEDYKVSKTVLKVDDVRNFLLETIGILDGAPDHYCKNLVDIIERIENQNNEWRYLIDSVTADEID